MKVIDFFFSDFKWYRNLFKETVWININGLKKMDGLTLGKTSEWIRLEGDKEIVKKRIHEMIEAGDLIKNTVNDIR